MLLLELDERQAGLRLLPWTLAPMFVAPIAGASSDKVGGGLLMGVGLTPDLFAATFSLARHAGWTAHVLEQAADNRLIRPDVRYIGPAERHLP